MFTNDVHLAMQVYDSILIEWMDGFENNVVGRYIRSMCLWCEISARNRVVFIFSVTRRPPPDTGP